MHIQFWLYSYSIGLLVYFILFIYEFCCVYLCVCFPNKWMNEQQQIAITNLYQWDACIWGFSDFIIPLAIPVLVATVKDYRPVFRLPFSFCLHCRFHLLHRGKCAYSHTCMCFQTSSSFLVRNLSVWDIYLCCLISRSSLQSLIPLVL